MAVQKGGYPDEDKIGVTLQVKVAWHYEYCLAFEYLHGLYPRVADIDAGFSAELPAGVVERLGMRARARLTEPVISDRTNFLKTTNGKLIDFTLKKPYLIAVLQEVRFVDTKGNASIVALRAGRRAAPRVDAGAQRYTRTGIFEWVSTFWVSLPSSRPLIPRRPCEPMKIRSQPAFSAASMMAS